MSMTKEMFIKEFSYDWENKLAYDHLYRYHLDVPVEQLQERLKERSKNASSTFIDDWDYPVTDWILEKILQVEAPIRSWLEDNNQRQPFVLSRHIPSRYGTILVDIDGKVYHPQDCFIVLKKECGKVDFVTAYPVRRV